MNRRLRNARESSQRDSFNWTAVFAASGIMVTWVLALVWFSRNEPRYLIVDDAMPFLTIVAGISFSFGWKTISNEIAKATPTSRLAAYYLGLASPMLALAAWLVAAIVLHYSGA